MLRFELRNYMYLPPIFKPRIMSPLNRGSGLFVPVPRGSAATAAPPPGYHISPLTGLKNSAGIRPRVRYFFISPHAGRSEIAAAPRRNSEIEPAAQAQ